MTALHLDPHAVIRVPISPLKRIIAEVAQEHRLKPELLRPGRRFARLVHARQEAAYRCHAETDASVPAIGRAMGGFDHTTILHGIRQHARRNGLPLPRGMGPGRVRPSTAGRRPPP